MNSAIGASFDTLGTLFIADCSNTDFDQYPRLVLLPLYVALAARDPPEMVGLLHLPFSTGLMVFGLTLWAPFTSRCTWAVWFASSLLGGLLRWWQVRVVFYCCCFCLIGFDSL